MVYYNYTGEKLQILNPRNIPSQAELMNQILHLLSQQSDFETIAIMLEHRCRKFVSPPEHVANMIHFAQITRLAIMAPSLNSRKNF